MLAFCLLKRSWKICWLASPGKGGRPARRASAERAAFLPRRPGPGSQALPTPVLFASTPELLRAAAVGGREEGAVVSELLCAGSRLPTSRSRPRKHAAFSWPQPSPTCCNSKPPFLQVHQPRDSRKGGEKVSQTHTPSVGLRGPVRFKFTWSDEEFQVPGQQARLSL